MANSTVPNQEPRSEDARHPVPVSGITQGGGTDPGLADQLTVHIPSALIARLTKIAEKRNTTVDALVTDGATLLLGGGDIDQHFERVFLKWWEHKGMGDPQQMVGAKARAKAIGYTLPFKLRIVLKMCLDQALL